MTDKEIKTAVKYAESWLNTGRECYEGYALERHATQYAKYVIALAQDLAALKEKCRWRKRSEEPAPNDDTLIICLLKKNRRCTWQAVIQARFINRFEEPENNIFFWRPLDLPEEGTK